MSGATAERPGKLLTPEPGQNQAQCALMLVGVGGLESFFGFGADHDGGDVSTPVVEVGLIALVEDNDQQRALKGRTGGQRHDDLALQPGIGLGEASA
jgi:hypothetical protein